MGLTATDRTTYPNWFCNTGKPPAPSPAVAAAAALNGKPLKKENTEIFIINKMSKAYLAIQNEYNQIAFEQRIFEFDDNHCHCHLYLCPIKSLKLWIN